MNSNIVGVRFPQAERSVLKKLSTELNLTMSDVLREAFRLFAKERGQVIREAPKQAK